MAADCRRAAQRSAAFQLGHAAVLVPADGPLAVAFNRGNQALHTELGRWDRPSLPAGCWQQPGLSAVAHSDPAPGTSTEDEDDAAVRG